MREWCLPTTTYPHSGLLHVIRYHQTEYFVREFVQGGVTVKFDQDHASCDGGAVLLKACDEKLELGTTLACCLSDDRQHFRCSVVPPIRTATHSSAAPSPSRRTARGETWLGYAFVSADFYPLPTTTSPSAPNFDMCQQTNGLVRSILLIRTPGARNVSPAPRGLRPGEDGRERMPEGLQRAANGQTAGYSAGISFGFTGVYGHIFQMIRLD